jgi:peptide chain release factor 1
MPVPHRPQLSDPIEFPNNRTHFPATPSGNPMIDKLNALEKKFEELNVQLADPEIFANPAVYQKHAQAHRELSNIVYKFREYKDTRRRIEETKALLAVETDPEMRNLADEELVSLLHLEEVCQQELKVLLTPKDPNDEKNVLLEIRAGTGGD